MTPRSPLWIALVLVVIAAGCGRKDEAPAAAPAAPPIVGLPAIDHPWTSVELGTASGILDDLCTAAPERMPVHGDRVFARVVAADNRDTLVAGPPASRHADARAHNAALLRIYAAYVRCGLPVEAFAANAALLEGYATSIASAQQVIAGLAADDPALTGKRAAFDQVATGLRGGVGSTVGMLTDPAIAAPPAEVAARLGRALAAVRTALPAGTLDPPLAGLTAAATAGLDPAHRAALDTITAALR